MISDYYTETFTVESPSTTKSAIGGWNPAYSELGSFLGWIDELTGDEIQLGAQFVNVATHIIGCSSTNSWVLDTYRIKDGDGLYYRILDVDNPIKRDHHLEILLEFNKTDQLTT